MPSSFFFFFYNLCWCLSSLSTPPTLPLLSSCLSPHRECVSVCVLSESTLCVHTSRPSLLCALWLSSSYLCQIKRKVRPAAPLSWKQTGMFFRLCLTKSFSIAAGRGHKFPILVLWRQLPPAAQLWQVILKMWIKKALCSWWVLWRINVDI